MKRRYPDRTANERRRRWVKKNLESLRASFGGCCGECGSTARLEFAHTAKTKIRGRGRGSEERIRDIKRNPEAYRLLCRPCHMDLDYGGLDPWEPRTPDPNQLELEEVPF